MKTKLILLGLLLALIACEDQANKKRVAFEKVRAAGCNLDPMLTSRKLKTKQSFVEENDTVYSYYKNDTLHFFVGLNETCCTPFLAQAESNNNALTMTITDTCNSYGDCYCKCMCYYTWDFEFITNNAEEITYIINLEKPLQGTSRPLIEGEMKNK